MISKPEWQAACDDLVAAGRQRVAPPTVEQVEALFRGDLPEAEANRVRELLVYYPEIARAMIEPFPSEVGGVLTDAERAADLAEIRRRLTDVPLEPVTPFLQRPMSSRQLALAAGVILALFLGAIAFLLPLRREARPVLVKMVYDDNVRGATTRGAPAQLPVELTAGSDYLLNLVFTPERPYRDYRVELFDCDRIPPRRLWSRSGVAGRPDGSFPIELSADLSPGRYQLVLYGVDANDDRLATYTIRLER